MRHAAHSILLMTAAVLFTGPSAAADSKAAPPANLRGTTAPVAAASKQNMPVPVQTKEIAPVNVATKPTAMKTAAAKPPAAKVPVKQTATAKHAEIKEPPAKSASPKQTAESHGTKVASIAFHTGAKPTTKHVPPRHVAAKRTPMKHVAHLIPSHGIAVPLDEVRVVQFSQPISTVYVGNPAIADVNIIDPRHAFVLGKAFGETNMVALDANGKQITNDHVSIFGHTGSMVTLHRGAMQMTFSCAASRCEVAPTPGDDKDSFTTHTGEAVAHQQWGLKSAALDTSSDQQAH